MRIFTTLILFVCFAFVANAQGNMQFNQVIRAKYTANSNGNTGILTAGTFTVPENKVWKIESGSIVPINDNLLRQSNELFVDNQLLYYWLGIEQNGSQINPPFVYNCAPIWLPSGDYTVTYRNRLVVNVQYSIAISAIEFNIVP